MTGQRRIEARLRAAGCVNAAEECAALTGAAPDRDALDDMVRRREQGEPLAWITGSVTFAERVLSIAPGVYVPRPQTEELARRAAAVLAPDGAAADLCTGCGAVAAHLAVEHPAATVVGVDIDIASVIVARRNGVAAVVGDLDAPLPSRRFDVVTAVVPYVPTLAIRFLPADVQRHEPRRALDGGADGLTIARRAVQGAARLLRSGGRLFMELGDDQHDQLVSTLSTVGFVSAVPWYDDDGDLRGVVAERA